MTRFSFSTADLDRDGLLLDRSDGLAAAVTHALAQGGRAEIGSR